MTVVYVIVLGLMLLAVLVAGGTIYQEVFVSPGKETVKRGEHMLWCTFVCLGLDAFLLVLGMVAK